MTWGISNFFKGPEKITIHKGLAIRYVFTCDRPYYELLHSYEMCVKRFKFAQQYINDLQCKIDSETLGKFMKQIKEKCNTGKLIDAWNLADEVEYRQTWLFEPDTLYRLASVMYFDLREDISDYDIEYNNNKITHWKKKDFLKLFLKNLTENSATFLNLSEEDSVGYLKELQEKLKKQKELISD